MSPTGRTRRYSEPEAALLEVGQFDSHGTARSNLRGKTIEVEHGIPGERVEALVFGHRRRWAKILKVVDASSERIDAPCPHFHEGCGGCQWQMLSYQSQVDRKIESLRAEIERAGLTIPIGDIHQMDDPWRYRMTAALSLGHACGFRRHGSQTIVALQDCPISHPYIGQIAAHLNRAFESGDLPYYAGQVSVEVRVVDDGQGPRAHTAIVPSPGSAHASSEAVSPITSKLAQLDFVLGIVYRHKQDAPQLLHGEALGTTVVCGRPFAVSAATFFQTNLILLPKLIHSVLASGFSSTDSVVDVYGGAGVFGLLVAPLVSRVVEIEIDPVGVEAAKVSVEKQGVTNVDLMAGTAEVVMEGLDHADAVIVDPPRAGLTPKVVGAIGRLLPKKILYISCFGGSLIRDIVSLREFGYEAAPIQAFDFYPQTRHLELFSRLERA